MMKKLGMVVFVMALIVAFALPAFAYTVEGAKGERFTMGFVIAYDIGYINRDAAYNGLNGVNSMGTMLGLGGGAVDRTQMINDCNGNTYLNGNFVVGDFQANWVLATSASIEGTGLSGTQLYNAGVDVFWGTYTFGNCALKIGKMNGQLFSLLYGGTFGYQSWSTSHTNMIGWGGQYDQKLPQIRFTQDVTKMLGYDISIVSPASYNETVNYTTTVGVAGTRVSYAQMPALAAKLRLNFGPVMLFPAAIYQQVKWDNLNPGWDNTMTAWMVDIPLMVKAGPFTGMFGVSYGVNSGNYYGYTGMTTDTDRMMYKRNAAGKIFDTTVQSAFVDLGFTFGPVSPHLYGGLHQSFNDTWKVAGADSWTKAALGVYVKYQLSANLALIPEFDYYDYGTMPGPINPYKLPAGKEWLGGVQFKFTF